MLTANITWSSTSATKAAFSLAARSSWAVGGTHGGIQTKTPPPLALSSGGTLTVALQGSRQPCTTLMAIPWLLVTKPLPSSMKFQNDGTFLPFQHNRHNNFSFGFPVPGGHHSALHIYIRIISISVFCLIYPLHNHLRTPFAYIGVICFLPWAKCRIEKGEISKLGDS